MKPLTHILCIVAGIAGPVAFEGWTTSDYGPRSKAHYARIVNASQAPRDKVIAFGLKAFGDGKPADAVREFFADDAVDHASGLAGKVAIAAKAGEISWLGGGAQKKLAHVAAERDLGFAHYVVGPTGEERVEIFRIKSGKIVEHWSVANAATAAIPSGDGNGA